MSEKLKIYYTSTGININKIILSIDKLKKALKILDNNYSQCARISLIIDDCIIYIYYNSFYGRRKPSLEYINNLNDLDSFALSTNKFYFKDLEKQIRRLYKLYHKNSAKRN